MTDQTPPAPEQQPATAGVPLTAAEDKTWAMWSHFGGLLYILPSLIIFLVFKDRGTLTKQESKEALNWQITFLIFYIAAFIVGAILAAIVGGVAVSTGNYGMLSSVGLISGALPFLTWVANAIFSIMGGVKVNGGGSYRYPVNFRFIK
ncbi:MAG: DUF4870 domain-containing protein [Terrimesophilobacter sp.]